MTAEMVRAGESAAVRDVSADVALATGTNLRVLISGETGVGKSRLARLLHEGSPRRARPFVAVTCAGTSDVVLAAELFGQSARGVHGRHHRGAFERADGGTLVLEEIGDTSAPVQGRLLQAIETGAVRPVGADAPLPPLDVRLIATATAPLSRRVEAGRFREDLFYRLNTVHIVITPIRTRPGDLRELMDGALRDHAGRAGRSVPRLTSSAWECLMRYSWPGNVRELRDAAAAVVFGGATRVGPEALPAHIVTTAGTRDEAAGRLGFLPIADLPVPRSADVFTATAGTPETVGGPVQAGLVRPCAN